MKNTFKLTIEAYGMTAYIEFDHDDVTTDEVLDAFKRLMIAVGFSEESINNYLNEK